MITITTTLNLRTEKERKEHIKESSHLIELFDEVILECPNGKHSYNFLKDLFTVGEQKNIISKNETREVVKIGNDEFEIHNMTKKWTSAYVNTKILIDISDGKLSFSDLEWN